MVWVQTPQGGDIVCQRIDVWSEQKFLDLVFKQTWNAPFVNPIAAEIMPGSTSDMHAIQPVEQFNPELSDAIVTANNELKLSLWRSNYSFKIDVMPL